MEKDHDIGRLIFFKADETLRLPTGFFKSKYRYSGMSFLLINHERYMPGIAVITNVIYNGSKSNQHIYQLLFNNSNGVRYAYKAWLKNTLI